jgi:hypothetical protein
MDPISDILGIVGLGMSIFGSMSAADDAKQAAEVSRKITGVEQQENDVRRQAMELSARRNQMETMRNAQRARAQGINSAVNQGANLGADSSVKGAQAQNTSQEAYGLQGINFNLGFGRQMFNYDDQISQYKQQLSTIQGQEATDQGWASLGGAIMKAGPTIGNFTKGFGNIGFMAPSSVGI